MPAERMSTDHYKKICNIAKVPVSVITNISVWLDEIYITSFSYVESNISLIIISFYLIEII